MNFKKEYCHGIMKESIRQKGGYFKEYIYPFVNAHESENGDWILMEDGKRKSWKTTKIVKTTKNKKSEKQKKRFIEKYNKIESLF